MYSATQDASASESEKGRCSAFKRTLYAATISGDLLLVLAQQGVPDEWKALIWLRRKTQRHAASLAAPSSLAIACPVSFTHKSQQKCNQGNILLTFYKYQNL